MKLRASFGNVAFYLLYNLNPVVQIFYLR